MVFAIEDPDVSLGGIEITEELIGVIKSQERIDLEITLGGKVILKSEVLPKSLECKEGVNFGEINFAKIRRITRG